MCAALRTVTLADFAERTRLFLEKKTKKRVKARLEPSQHLSYTGMSERVPYCVVRFSRRGVRSPFSRRSTTLPRYTTLSRQRPRRRECGRIPSFSFFFSPESLTRFVFNYYDAVRGRRGTQGRAQTIRMMGVGRGGFISVSSIG